MNMNFKNVIIFGLLLITIALMLWGKDEPVASTNDAEIMVLTAENDALLSSVYELETQIAQKDSMIKIMKALILKNDQKVKQVKIERDEKINSIASLPADSLYKLFARYQY